MKLRQEIIWPVGRYISARLVTQERCEGISLVIVNLVNGECDTASP